MFLFILSLFSAFSYIEFHSLRVDQTMPAHCVQMTSAYFEIPHQKVIYGIEGAKQKGFTHEIDLKRQEARDLWRALNEDTQSMEVVSASEKLSHLKFILDTEGKDMGFDYAKEGDILEALALLDLEKTYPDSEYFRTGGYEYSNGHGPTVGELDVLVGRKSDCRIIIIGEAKLGHKMLGKARQQLQRFEDFYQRER